MSFNKILDRVAGKSPFGRSDDEIEIVQRVEAETMEEKEIRRGIEKCKMIAELVAYLQTISGIRDTENCFYSGQDLAGRVERQVAKFRTIPPAKIRSMHVEVISRALAQGQDLITDSCGLRNKLAKLIHGLRLES